jgi:hypothetical protein
MSIRETKKGVEKRRKRSRPRGQQTTKRQQVRHRKVLTLGQGARKAGIQSLTVDQGSWWPQWGSFTSCGATGHII